MTKSDPVAALQRILTAAVVDIEATNAPEALETAFAFVLSMAHVLPRNSIFAHPITCHLCALEIMTERDDDDNPDCSKALARRLTKRIAKAKAKTEVKAK